MTEQEINNLIDSKIAKTKMSQLPEATQTSGLYSIGYNGNQSVKYKANLLQGDPLTVRKTYQTEALALADKNPIDTATSLPLKVGQFVSIVDDGEKNGIYRIGSISGDGTMSLELQGKVGDLSYKANHGYESNPKTLKEVDDEKADHGYASIAVAKTLKEVEDNTSVKMTNLVVNGGFESGVPSWNGNLILSEEEKLSGDSSGYVDLNNSTSYSTIDIACDLNDKLYISVSRRFKSIERIGANRIGVFDFGGLENRLDITPFYNDNLDVWETTTAIVDGRTNGIRLGVGFFGASTVQYFVDNFIAVNLTETFGKGSEPTKEEFELLLVTLGIDFFEGEISIPAQKVMQWQLAMGVKMTNLIVTNLIVNGGFESGVPEWFSTQPILSGEEKLSGDSSGYMDLASNTSYSRVDIACDLNDKLYISVSRRFKSVVEAATNRIAVFDFGGLENRHEIAPFYNDNLDVWETTTAIVDGRTNGIRFAAGFFGNTTAQYFVDNFIAVNLTRAFGKGNEPTKEEFELLLATLGIDFFEGEISIPAQKIMQWQLKLIRENKNDIDLVLTTENENWEV